ncbi:hypothetical protein EA462_02220 [Natrarchaeobius halalkaliphilus]|uniref:Uncharacterized protein n=2 Tax=Natrarchaeobius halalkaliphilus TaxID=1679091 RepID=A0A3N6P4W3_9EURY|nr:hypothetical protein EA462_02220 [Natrarchaeobius halalkaliphilus]
MMLEGFEFQSECINPHLETGGRNEYLCLSDEGDIQTGIGQLAKEIFIQGQNQSNLNTEATLKVDFVKDGNSRRTGPDWLKNNFTRSEQEKIIDRRRQMFHNYGVLFHMILWPGATNYFPEIGRFVNPMGNIRSSMKYNISKNFDRLVKDIYSIDQRNERWFRDKKIYELKKYKPSIQVLTIQVDNPTFKLDGGGMMCKEVYNMKVDIRKNIQKDRRDYIYGTCVHATDEFKHNIHVERVLSEIENGEYNPEKSTEEFQNDK